MMTPLQTNQLRTRTGGFPIGIRIGFSQWQKDLEAMIDFALGSGIGLLDLREVTREEIAKVRAAGLGIGSVDLPDWRGMISPDAVRRKETVCRNSAYIKEAAEAGGMNFFCVMLPEKPDLPRSENFGCMVESYGELAATLEATGSRLVIEGWPGPGALCCTPEGYRGIMKAIDSASIGINYDPSHLIRMEIDPVRFLIEFHSRIYHVHGKDTSILSEWLYEFGNLQPATFAKAPSFGGAAWRYTIPGHGVAPWSRILGLLEEGGYQGGVCIELEDANFNGSMAGEQEGYQLAASFLSGA